MSSDLKASLEDTHAGSAQKYASEEVSNKGSSDDGIAGSKVAPANDDHLPQPRLAVKAVVPESPRRSVQLARRAASFHKKILKATVTASSPESRLKLGTIRSADIATLALVIRVAVLIGPILQIIWTVYVEPDIAVPDLDERVFQVSSGDAIEATIQVVAMVMAVIFIRRIVKDQQRQAIQVSLAMLISFLGAMSTLTFASDMAKSHRDLSRRGRTLLSFANALLATFLYTTVAVLTDHFAEALLSTATAFEYVKLERLRERSRRLSLLFNVALSGYIVLRLVVTWRISAVLDFIPMVNVITPFRILYVEHKEIKQAGLLASALLVSSSDALLLILAFVKCQFTHRLFNFIFIDDFAKWYTEYRVFVADFQTTVATIVFAGHVAAWAVPFYHTIDPARLAQPVVDVQYLGSVQMQLGFRLSLMLWLIAIMYCALPADSTGVRGWFVGSPTPREETGARVKYYVYESDVHVKTGYRNLAKAANIDSHRFILEHQIEAFNFAQLVYARGNKNYDQHTDTLTKLIEDQRFSVVAAIHDAATDTHCLVISSTTKIIVTFRGTLSKKNTKTDLQSSMTVHHGAETPAGYGAEKRTLWHRVRCKRNPPRVHSGFYSAYSTVADQVLDHVRALHTADPRPIFVTGHSLGGALAALCSFDLVTKLGTPNVSCTTFGCPRLGNNAFRKRYNLAVPATFAFINASDMITKLPPKTPKAQSYASVGMSVLVNDFGNLVIEPNALELAVLHRGYSGKAHTMRAYQLSILLWCLRFHKNQYQPKFWRQSLMALRTEYGYIPEVRDYVSTVVSTDCSVQVSLDQVNLEGIDHRSRLRRVASLLETALVRLRENNELDSIATTAWLSGITQWLWPSRSDWYSAADAVSLLKALLKLESTAAALEMGQALALHGFIELDKAILTINSRLHFPVLEDGFAANEEEQDDDATARS